MLTSSGLELCRVVGSALFLTPREGVQRYLTLPFPGYLLEDHDAKKKAAQAREKAERELGPSMVRLRAALTGSNHLWRELASTSAPLVFVAVAV